MLFIQIILQCFDSILVDTASKNDFYFCYSLPLLLSPILIYEIEHPLPDRIQDHMPIEILLIDDVQLVHHHTKVNIGL